MRPNPLELATDTERTKVISLTVVVPVVSKVNKPDSAAELTL